MYCLSFTAQADDQRYWLPGFPHQLDSCGRHLLTGRPDSVFVIIRYTNDNLSAVFRKLTQYLSNEKGIRLKAHTLFIERVNNL